MCKVLNEKPKELLEEAKRKVEEMIDPIRTNGHPR